MQHLTDGELGLLGTGENTRCEDRGQGHPTYTGRWFFPFDPRPGDFDIVVIAHALAKVARYGGHAIWFYSVLQHSLIMSRLFKDPILALAALFHDGGETYIGDMIRPLKREIPVFEKIDQRILSTLFAQLGLPWPIHEAVLTMDNIMLATEKRDILAPQERDWGPLPEPLALPIVPDEDWRSVFHAFLDRYEELTGERLKRPADTWPELYRPHLFGKVTANQEAACLAEIARRRAPTSLEDSSRRFAALAA